MIMLVEVHYAERAEGSLHMHTRKVKEHICSILMSGPQGEAVGCGAFQHSCDALNNWEVWGLARGSAGTKPTHAGFSKKSSTPI